MVVKTVVSLSKSPEERAGKSKKRPLVSRSRGVTIEEVATFAAVSKRIATRVLNKNAPVRQADKARVEQVIAQFAYTSKLAGRRNGRERSKLLLAVFQNPEPNSRGGMPMEKVVLAGLAACSMRGYRLLFKPIAQGLSRDKAVAQLNDTLSSVKPDGVILLPPFDFPSDLRAALDRRGIAQASLREDDDCISNAGELAAQHLLALGHRQVGFITGPGEPSSSDHNLAGYRRALVKKGSRAHRHFVAADQPDITSVHNIARAWLLPTIRPTAIITETAQASLAVLHVALSLNIDVPRELSLIALEDNPALAVAYPSVAVLEESLASVFTAACDRLITSIAAEHDREEKHKTALTSGLRLVERESLGRAPRAI